MFSLVSRKFLAMRNIALYSVSIDFVGGHLFHNQFGKNMIYTRDFKKYAKMLIEMCVIEK